MNYIKELNAFRRWLLDHELPPSAVALWHTLMGINNSVQWKQRFNAPTMVAQQFSGLSKSGINVARKVLVEKGLINYEPGHKGKAPIYEMNSLVTYFERYEYQSGDLSKVSSVNKPGAILKEKDKEIKREEEEGAVFKTYEENIETLTPILKAELTEWVHVLGEELVMEGITLMCKYKGRSFRYLEKVLMEWKVAGLTRLGDVRVYENNNVSQQEKTIPFVKPTVKRSVFDELRAEVTG